MSRSSNALMQGSSLEFNYQGSGIEKQGYYVELFLFSERTMLYSHVAVQIFIPSISAWSAVFCNCLNCLLRRAFNRCKLIFSVSKIPPACSVCSLSSPCSEIFTDELCGSIIHFVN